MSRFLSKFCNNGILYGVNTTADNIVNNHKYDAEYISYIRNGNSAAVLITRDLVKSVNTIGKWIDIIDSNIRGRIDGRINFNYFIVEIFPRKTKPDYSKAASEYDKKYITWQTACKDIKNARNVGYKGPRYKIWCSLYNDRKKKVVRKYYNKKFGRWMPDGWLPTDSCVLKDKIEFIDNWKYKIKSIREL